MQIRKFGHKLIEDIAKAGADADTLHDFYYFRNTIYSVMAKELEMLPERAHFTPNSEQFSSNPATLEEVTKMYSWLNGIVNENGGNLTDAMQDIFRRSHSMSIGDTTGTLPITAVKQSSKKDPDHLHTSPHYKEPSPLTSEEIHCIQSLAARTSETETKTTTVTVAEIPESVTKIHHNHPHPMNFGTSTDEQYQKELEKQRIQSVRNFQRQVEQEAFVKRIEELHVLELAKEAETEKTRAKMERKQDLATPQQKKQKNKRSKKKNRKETKESPHIPETPHHKVVPDAKISTKFITTSTETCQPDQSIDTTSVTKEIQTPQLQSNEHLLYIAFSQICGVYGFAKNLEAAEKILITLATDKNYVEAQFFLGKCYLFGEHGFKQNIAEAERFFLLATEAGNLRAQTYLSFIYIADEKALEPDICSILQFAAPTNQNTKKGLELLELTANQGDSLAQTYMGIFYLYGFGTAFGYKKNLEKASEYLSASAEQKEIVGIYVLAFYYKDIENFTEAKKLLEKIIEINPKFSDAINALAFFYNEGLGMPKNPDKAFELYGQAAQLCCPEALCNLSRFYYKKGESSVAINLVKNAISIKPSAEFYAILGYIYTHSGEDTPVNYEEAETWLNEGLCHTPNNYSIIKNLFEIFVKKREGDTIGKQEIDKIGNLCQKILNSISNPLDENQKQTKGIALIYFIYHKCLTGSGLSIQDIVSYLNEAQTLLGKEFEYLYPVISHILIKTICSSLCPFTAYNELRPFTNSFTAKTYIEIMKLFEQSLNVLNSAKNEGNLSALFKEKPFPIFCGEIQKFIYEWQATEKLEKSYCDSFFIKVAKIQQTLSHPCRHRFFSHEPNKNLSISELILTLEKSANSETMYDLISMLDQIIPHIVNCSPSQQIIILNCCETAIRIVNNRLLTANQTYPNPEQHQGHIIALHCNALTIHQVLEALSPAIPNRDLAMEKCSQLISDCDSKIDPVNKKEVLSKLSQYSV